MDLQTSSRSEADYSFLVFRDHVIRVSAESVPAGTSLARQAGFKV